ncbi:MAG: tRNA (adenosine(37)-N6)-dimethylallyltransferase MiaA [Actinobacteria bacterium]|nr:tRNA (adenosine(37)-N6)-dimethylallyltransferase MiaA [Actinomycetota bacterium]
MTRILALLGPTASGKSEIALAVADRRQIPIVSVDSMQVYRGLDIGTAKPTAAEQAEVQHHMIDVVEPEVDYSVAEFQGEARRLIAAEGEVLIVGGSGLHFRSIVDPLEFPPTDPELRSELETMPDPVAALVGADPGAGEVVDLANPRRVVRALEIFYLTGLTPSMRGRQQQRRHFDDYVPHHHFVAAGLDAGHALGERIVRRVQAMRERGWWDEVQSLGSRLGRTASGAVGYGELRQAQMGHRDPEKVWGDITVATNGLARRQRTYFRRDPRIRWVPWTTEFRARLSAVEEMLDLT